VCGCFACPALPVGVYVPFAGQKLLPAESWKQTVVSSELITNFNIGPTNPSTHFTNKMIANDPYYHIMQLV
jgi:hypothetical protein